MKKVLIVIMMFMVVLVGCASDEKAEVEEIKTEYRIGETVELDKFHVTLSKVRYVNSDEFLKPEDGEVWVALEFTFENVSDKSEYVAGIFELTLRDDEGREKDINIWGDIEGSLDGDVLGGEKLTGEKSFTLKDSDTTLTAYYKSTFSGKDPIKFVFEVGEIQ